MAGALSKIYAHITTGPLCIVFVGFTLNLRSQEPVKESAAARNSYYFEFFGQGLYYSFNYDRLIKTTGPLKNSYSAGLTLLPHPELFVVAVPASYNVFYGEGKHHLELGLGFTPMFIKTKSSASETWQDASGTMITNVYDATQNNYYTYLTTKIGYRLQKKEGGFFMRATFTPAVGLVSYEGTVKGGYVKQADRGHLNMLGQTAFFPYPAVPWLGLSIGWTGKK